MSLKPGTEYFSDVCLEVLGPWFEERGFTSLDAYCSSTMVAYRRLRTFMRVSYWPSDAPNFTLMVGLGELKEGWGLFGPRKPLLHGMGLWELIKADADRAVLRQPFHDREELGSLLGQVRDRTFRYAEDILGEPQRLNRAIRRKA
ncbi:MAG: hypothetical protein QOK05_2243 [Chloroflexota bacterium]|jgi:hypothetical protein|nr:hypothetical protein [Chloroflexota bacterium]